MTAERVEPSALPDPSASVRTTRVYAACGLASSVLRTLWSRIEPAMLAGAAVEAAWLGAHLATYPVGYLIDRGRGGHQAYRIEHLPPLQRGMIVSNLEAAGTPILLVHGFIDNRSIFALLRRGLTKRGFNTIYSMDYSTLTTDVRTAAILLGAEIERIVEETGYERIHVVGHSLGGLIARYYVTRLAGDERVHTLVTLGTPHAGTYVAYALPMRILAQLRPGSALLEELSEGVRGCRTRFIAYWSDNDEAVLPHSGGQLTHPDLAVRNVRLHGLGHLSLPFSGEVVHGVATALAQLDPEGHTMAAGVTPLGSA